jgi:hypothetical protein
MKNENLLLSMTNVYDKESVLQMSHPGQSQYPSSFRSHRKYFVESENSQAQEDELRRTSTYQDPDSYA